jgi:hypothetical protein
MQIRDKFAAACIATALAGTGVTYHQLATAHADPVADVDRYAERDKAAEEQAEFQGGDYLVVGISTTAAVVLLVLVLLLV